MSHAQTPVRIAQHTFVVHTRGRGLVEISDRLREALAQTGLHAGVASVFVHHTSCSLIVGENADPTVAADLERFFARLVPDGDPLFRHDAEGPDDMPAHVRSVLTGVSLTIPFHAGRLALGTWQGVFLWEHRSAPHQRRVTASFLGH